MEPEKKSNGAFVGLSVIIIILIIGGIYMWQSKVKKTLEEKEQATTLTEQDSSDLDMLGQEAGSTDTNVGVDANTVY